MSTQEVCRLCLSKGNLLSVFDKRIEGTNLLKDVILITTGVEIHSEDVITRKICSTCSQDAVKMYQFRQKSLKNDKYLKAQCRQLLKHTNLKISDPNVTSELKSVNIGEKKQEPRRTPSYRVHPTMTSLSRKYPKLQFPSICVLSNVDPCVCMEMDTVENYFKSRNLNLKKYAHLALIASKKNISNKSSAIMKSSEKNTEYSETHGINNHLAQSAPSAISETVDDAEVANRVMPINIKLNQSGYTIVRPSTEIIINGKDKNVCESTSSCDQLITDSSESQSEIRRANKRRLSDSILLLEPEIKKVSSANPSKMISVLSNIEIKSPTVFKCNICGSIQLSAKHLKKHRIRHSRCKFCKIQFKSVEMKQQHIKNSCLVKEALDNKTNVEVERIELNMNGGLHHQDAFTAIPPSPGLDKKDSAPILSEAAEEIIEIISDDEETPVATIKPICSTVIRPAVRMKNDNVLDNLKTPAPNIEIMKELLTKFKSLQSVTDEATQTELSTTESIRMDEENLTTELINVKQILHSYQVPVEIRKGSKISASYNYQRTQPKPKKLKLWTDLTPIDVETENTSVSNRTANIEHVTPATHSNNITTDVDLPNKGNSGDSSSNDQSSLQNIGSITPVSSNRSYPTSDSLQTKSPAITPTQIEPLTPTPECFNVVEAGPLATIPTQSSSNAEIQNRRKLLESPHALQIFPVQATSPVTDNANSRHSPKSSGIDQLTSHINSDTVETHSVPSSSPCGRIPSSADQTTSIPTSCALCYVNSDTPRKSSVQNNTDLNANCSLSNSQCGVVGCTIMTRNDSADRTIEYVVNNYSKSVCTGNTNVRPPNGVIYSNNNQQTSSYNSQARSKSTMIQWNQNVRQHFETATTNYHNTNVSSSTNSNVSSQNPCGNKGPIQNTSLADHNVYFERPQSYSHGSTPVNQTPQSYISAHTSNIAQAVDAANTVHTADGNYNAYLQCPRVQAFTSFQTVVGITGTYMPNAPLNSEAHHRQTGHFTVSNRLKKIRPHPKVSESFGSYGNEPSTVFPHYSKARNYVNGSITVSPVSQNFDVNNKQLPNAYAYQPSLAACDTLPSDQSQYFPSGLIRVRNVRELT